MLIINRSLFVFLSLLIISSCSMNNRAYSPSTVSAKSSTLSELDSVLSQYEVAMLANNTSKIISLIYPPIFEVVSKEKVKQSYDKLSASNMKIMSIKHEVKGQPTPFSKGVYQVVDYTAKLKTLPPNHMIAKLRKDTQTAKGLVAYEKTMGRLMKTITRSDRVELDKESLGFILTKSAQYLAIKENNKQWKLLDVPTKSAKALNQSKVLPVEIIKVLKALKEKELKKSFK